MFIKYLFENSSLAFYDTLFESYLNYEVAKNHQLKCWLDFN